MSDVRKNAEALKRLLLEGSEELVKNYVDVALGRAELKSNNSEVRAEVWDALKQMMINSSDRIELDVQSAADGIKAVTDGKCTFEEGKQLMTLYESAKKIDVADKVGVAGGNSFQVVVLTSAEASEASGASEAKVLEHKDGD